MNFAPRPSDRRIPLTETAPHHSTGIAKLHRSRLLKRVNTALKDVCQVKSSRSKVEYGRGECQRPRYGVHLHIGQGRPLGTLNMQGSSRQPLRVPRRESNLKGNSSLSQTSCNFGDAARNYMPMRVFARFGIAWLTVLSASGALGPFALGWTRGGAEPGLPQSTSTQDAVANGSSPQTWVAKGPESEQARYLLGMCQVFTKHYDEGIKILQPLWSSRSSDVLYLYLMDIAAVESKKKELDEKILKQMIAVGGGTPEFHLILGKAYLKRDEVPQATAELERALEMNPRLPFIHLNLGIAYMRSADNEGAEAEFQKEIAVDPDLA